MGKGSYSISYLEHDFNFHCPNEVVASEMNTFIDSSFHRSYLKKPSLLLPMYPTGYRSNARQTKSQANRIYVPEDDPTIAELEYVGRGKWIKRNFINSVMDCFLVDPMSIVKNSSFRSFDFSGINKTLRRGGMPSNIASRIINDGKKLWHKNGFDAAYWYFKSFVRFMNKACHTPLHAFDNVFMSAIDGLSFAK